MTSEYDTNLAREDDFQSNLYTFMMKNGLAPWQLYISRYHCDLSKNCIYFADLEYICYFLNSFWMFYDKTNVDAWTNMHMFS